MSHYQPIRSASVLETLLEPPRLSSGPLVSYLTQGNSGMSSVQRPRGGGVGSEVSNFGLKSICEVVTHFGFYLVRRVYLSTLVGLVKEKTLLIYSNLELKH